MTRAVDLLVRYAAFHRDRRNIATHLVGVPLIVLAVGALLARPGWSWAALHLSPAWLLYGAAAAWYLTRGEPLLGAAVSALVGALVLAGQAVAAPGITEQVTRGAVLFAVGWTIQFVGHFYEGRKPAFLDDVRSLLVGPMFVTAELLFAAGWNPGLAREIERRAGRTRLRDLALD